MPSTHLPSTQILSADTPPTTLVTAATGKTGARVAARLQAIGWPVRAASRSATPPFDWDDAATWPAALRGVDQVYLAYAPDLAVPGAFERMERFVTLAAEHGVHRIVLLSGRGEPVAQACERMVLASGVPATVVRASWFAQNFSEGHFAPALQHGALPFEATDVGEPFVHVDDIADVAVAALTEPGHAGALYEVTGPALLTMAEAVAQIGAAAGRPIEYIPMAPAAYEATLVQAGVPAALAGFLTELSTTTLDGRNAYVADGVQRALGRAPRSFEAFVREAAAAGAWAAS